MELTTIGLKYKNSNRKAESQTEPKKNADVCKSIFKYGRFAKDNYFSFLKLQINTDPEKKKLKTNIKTHKRTTKNAIKGIDLNQASFQYFGGVDVMSIEGMSHATILSIISEIGPEGFQ